MKHLPLEYGRRWFTTTTINDRPIRIQLNALRFYFTSNCAFISKLHAWLWRLIEKKRWLQCVKLAQMFAVVALHFRCRRSLFLVKNLGKTRSQSIPEIMFPFLSSWNFDFPIEFYFEWNSSTIIFIFLMGWVFDL